MCSNPKWLETSHRKAVEENVSMKTCEANSLGLQKNTILLEKLTYLLKKKIAWFRWFISIWHAPFFEDKLVHFRGGRVGVDGEGGGKRSFCRLAVREVSVWSGFLHWTGGQPSAQKKPARLVGKPEIYTKRRKKTGHKITCTECDFE